MATIGTASSSSYENTSRRSYISTMAFNADFFTYTTSVDSTTYATTGTLITVSGADAGNSPLGRVLRETGRKLVPGANPGITVYMVEVFDNTTFLRGFINPNSPVFAPFNSDRPAFMEEPYVINQDVSGGTYGTPGTFSGTQNYGSSVLTRGNILADGYVETGGQIRCLQQSNMLDAAYILAYGNSVVNVALGQIFTRNFTGAAVTLTAINASVGDRITLVANVQNTGVVITFGSGFADAGNAVFNVTGVGLYTYSFIGADNGSGTVIMYETSRIGPLT